MRALEGFVLGGWVRARGTPVFQSDPVSANGTETYHEDWYATHRREGHRLVHSYLRLQRPIHLKVRRLEQEYLGRAIGRASVRSGRAGAEPTSAAGASSLGSPVLGVHMRGTDKGKYLATAGSGRQVSPAEYLPYIHAFLAAYPNGSIFVATDSPSFLQEVILKWPAGRVRYRADVHREEGNVAFTKSRTSNYLKGEEVLPDTLLLSKCDWLLHAASGVAEFAIYWNLKLHKRSIHLQYIENRQRPFWMPAKLAAVP